MAEQRLSLGSRSRDRASVTAPKLAGKALRVLSEDETRALDVGHQAPGRRGAVCYLRGAHAVFPCPS